MNFKAHMTLLSWRELLQWMESRGDEAAKLLTPTCLDILKQDRIHNIMTDEMMWDRTSPGEKPGVLSVLLTAYNFNNQEVQFEFGVKESDWFSHKPLEVRMFKHD